LEYVLTLIFKIIKTGLLDITMVKMVEWCSSISWWSYKI